MAKLADLIRPGAGRGLDFVVVGQLQKRTSIVPTEILKFAVSEMVSNALDTDATEIHIEIGTVGMFDEVTVRDNVVGRSVLKIARAKRSPSKWLTLLS